MKDRIYDILVIGGGPAGYTAALYGVRSGFSVAVLEKLSPGGQMAATGEIENYPGFPDPVDGFELGERMQAGAERFGAETVYADVQGFDFTAEPKKVLTSEGEFLGRAIILCMGASARLAEGILPQEMPSIWPASVGKSIWSTAVIPCVPHLCICAALRKPASGSTGIRPLLPLKEKRRYRESGSAMS